MHPYQDQVNKMGELIRLQSQARRKGSWLEAVNYWHALLEIEMKVLLTSKAGKDAKPLTVDEIDKAGDLMGLANLAKNNEFIDDRIFAQLDAFDKNRKDRRDLEKTANSASEIYYAVQSKFITITIG